jgi:hypothetical protein
MDPTPSPQPSPLRGEGAHRQRGTVIGSHLLYERIAIEVLGALPDGSRLLVRSRAEWASRPCHTIPCCEYSILR